MRALRTIRHALNFAMGAFLIWLLLTVLLVEDNGEYARRARDWSRAAAHGVLR